MPVNAQVIQNRWVMRVTETLALRLDWLRRVMRKNKESMMMKRFVP